MRVLDLGASDGYLSRWLARQLDSLIEVDGIDADPAAVARANTLAVEQRMKARYVRGRAEDAAMYFPPGRYDAVVLFELLEHVADPDRLLDVAEQMVNAEGLVFVSTPDGTFGAGRNPNHLRAWRAIDVADMLRRRGRIRDLSVGPDGVTIAAYTPTDRLADVAIYCGPGWEKWGPGSIEQTGLGGSETAAVRLAEALSQIGWCVTVYGHVDDGCAGDVIYRDWRAFDPMEPRQAVISSRLPEIFDRCVAARHRLLWVHDVDVQDRLTGDRADRIDHILTLSRWHEQHMQGRYPFAAAKVTRIRNGVHLPYFTGPAPARGPRVAYTSSPDRGLDILLELWPRVRAQVPDAELRFAYSPVYFAIAEKDPVVAAHAARVRRLAKQDGVRQLAPLGQHQVAQLMRSSRVWCAPSFNTPSGQPFMETSCIGAMEAQAAGALVVASNWGALADTVQVGRLIDGPPNSDRWRDAFVAEIVDGLTNSETQAWAQTDGPRAAAGFGWLDVGVQVAKLIR